MLALIFLLVCFSVIDSKYNAKLEISKRVKYLHKTCETYRNNPKYQHLLEDKVNDPSAHYVQNWATKLFMCVPSENGAIPWNRFFREVHNYDLKVNL